MPRPSQHPDLNVLVGSIVSPAGRGTTQITGITKDRGTAR